MNIGEIRKIMNEGIVSEVRENVKDVKNYEISHNWNSIIAGSALLKMLVTVTYMGIRHSR